MFRASNGVGGTLTLNIFISVLLLSWTTRETTQLNGCKTYSDRIKSKITDRRDFLKSDESYWNTHTHTLYKTAPPCRRERCGDLFILNFSEFGRGSHHAIQIIFYYKSPSFAAFSSRRRRRRHSYVAFVLNKWPAAVCVVLLHYCVCSKRRRLCALLGKRAATIKKETRRTRMKYMVFSFFTTTTCEYNDKMMIIVTSLLLLLYFFSPFTHICAWWV